MTRALLLIAVLATHARADDPADDTPDKREARAMLREGVRLLSTGDNPGALKLFRAGYKKYPSAKILLNIGSTLATMGHGAAAANTYQRYLEDPQADPERRDEVVQLLAALDAKLGRLAVEGGVEVEIDGAWVRTAFVRITPGAYELHARKPGMQPATARGVLAAGESAVAAFVFAPVVVVMAPLAVPSLQGGDLPIASTHAYGAMLDAIVDARGRGGAGLAGAFVDVHDRLQLQLGALISSTVGVYAGAFGYVLTGSIRPLVGVGVPLLFSSGARVAVRGSVGVEWRMSPRIALVAVLGVEHYFDPERDIDRDSISPLVGVTGRL